ncbi:MAG TPA: alanine dehydrogenase, partial [Minicystis sp.]|nr:alanine dehydrogenase [Minicystis sp.]
MLIGVPKEIKTREYRVGMTPAGVRALVAHGHRVLVEAGAGEGSAIGDDAYTRAGATIVKSAADAWGAEMVVKVKEPLPSEYGYFRDGLLLYTYLHLAAESELTKELAKKKVMGVAYETIQLEDGSLPLLRPMSEVAGRMAVQVGASCLEKERGGKGVLLGGVPGTRRGRVVILGGGVVGRNAATIAVGMGAQVTVLDVRAETMSYLEDVFGGAIETLYSNAENIENTVTRADLVIGAVLVPGAKAPQLVTEELIGRMEKGSVVVDVAVDQGGC